MSSPFRGSALGMGDDGLAKRDRDLYERLRAKGVGRKLARRIAGAPDVERGEKGTKKARKAAKKAARRLERDAAQAAGGARDDAGPLASGPTLLPPAPDVLELPAAGETAAGPSPTEGPLRAAAEAAGVGPVVAAPAARAPAAPAPAAPRDEDPQPPARGTAWRRRTAGAGRAPALRRSTGGGRGARRRRRAGGAGGGP